MTQFEITWKKYFYWLCFFMAFPAIIIFQNISVYFFAALIFAKFKYGVNTPSEDKLLFWLGLFFSFGALMSAFNTPVDEGPDNFSRAISAMPNYMYWGILIAFLVSTYNYIEINTVHKAIFRGVIIYIIYYHVREWFLKGIPIFQKTSENNFAFLMICFSPTAVYYANKKYGIKWAIVLWLIIMALLLSMGRRAGFSIVGILGLAALNMRTFGLKTIIGGLVFTVVSVVLVNTSVVEKAILAGNERIYGLIYDTETVQTEDRSYLTRMAMVEKGLNLFEKYPITGVGLTNFSQVEGEIEGNFEGAKYVLNKADINNLSAHNSYISILSEGGLLLFVPFVSILATLILYFILNFSKINPDYKPLYLSILGMSVHFYFISAAVNVYAWFLIAICSALKYKK